MSDIVRIINFILMILYLFAMILFWILFIISIPSGKPDYQYLILALLFSIGIDLITLKNKHG